MTSAYLAQSEFAAYGVPNATVAQVTEASCLIDAYLQRPCGLEWLPDYQGSPCYMAALTPSFTSKLTGPIAPGSNVVLPFPQASYMSTVGLVGSVVVLETESVAAGGTNNIEACVVSANTPSTITLTSVALSHAAGASVNWGLVINEQKILPSKRAVVRLGNWPIARIISGLGSYRYGRRNDQQAGLYDDRNLLSIMQTFGGPPAWQAFDVTASDWNPITSEVWIPSGIQMAYYSDVRLYYVAGYSQASIPALIKTVCANIIKGGCSASDMQGGIKVARAGDTTLERFSATILDDDTRRQMNLYKARAYA